MPTRVLILEPDEAVLAEIAAYIRRNSDFVCEEATSGQECVEKLTQFSPDVLIMEPSLPCKSADEILNAIGSLTDRTFLPVLILSRVDQDPSQKLHECIAGYLVKPQTLANVVDAIRRITSTQSSTVVDASKGSGDYSDAQELAS